jgi:invasion protein IalB
MRETLTGIALAVVLIAGLFAWDFLAPHKSIAEAIAQNAAAVQPGYAGTKEIGPWQLVCEDAPAAGKPAPVPFSLSRTPRPAPAASVSAGRCRVTLDYRQKKNPTQILMIASFRLIGDARKLVMIVRMPAIARKGDALALRLGEKALKLPIAECQKGGCVAIAPLGLQAEAVLLAAPAGQLLLPPGPNGKRAGLPFPVIGLGPALNAMRRAES